MKVLQRYLLSEFFKTLIGAVLFFTFIVSLAEVLAELQYYMRARDVIPLAIRYHILRFPYIIYYVLPISMMFTTSFVLGNLVKNNEMISIFNAGVSLFRFIRSVLILAFLVSVGTLAFWEYIVAPTVQEAELKHREIWKMQISPDYNFNVSLFGKDNRIYLAKKYDIKQKTLFDTVILTWNPKGYCEERIYAKELVWNERDAAWDFKNVVHVTFTTNNEVKDIEKKERARFAVSELPYHFEKDIFEMRFMSLKQNARYIKKLKDIHGHNIRAAETEYHYKVALSFVTLVIVILSAAFARFSSQSVLVLSFTFVIASSMVYYLFIFVGTSLARSEVLNPIVGAWLGNIVFLVVGPLLFRYNNA